MYFLDPAVPLYTVYVFDDGTTCRQLPHRFFASVNGDMIRAGTELARTTGDRRYLDQALATARAVAGRLVDGRGVFVDLPAENDVVEPLVEGMAQLAARYPFARGWILRNAARVALAGPRHAYGQLRGGACEREGRRHLPPPRLVPRAALSRVSRAAARSPSP